MYDVNHNSGVDNLYAKVPYRSIYNYLLASLYGRAYIGLSVNHYFFLR